jgi:glycosyltransferase involved in cell wall biosynthesis
LNSLKVAYILLYFPRLTETFVAEEIQAIRSLGIEVQIVSLLSAESEPVQPLSQELLPLTWYAPGLQELALWRANFGFLRKSPRMYFSLLLDLLRQPFTDNPFGLIAKRLTIFLKAAAVARNLEGSDVQLLHTHFAWLSGAATWIISRLLGLPFTVTVHAYEIYSTKNDLLRLVSQQANQVVAISDYNRSQVATMCSLPAEAISLVHCGVNLTGLQVELHEKEKTRGEIPLRILSVGSLVSKKGHTYLIRACHFLKERGIAFQCSIIGGGPGESTLRNLIETYDLQNHVELLGARPHPEIIQSYHEHDVFVLASVVAPSGDRDGIPVVLMEAGAIGMPLISTEVSGIPELVRHGQTGLLVPPEDPLALAEAIMTFARDPKMQSRLGDNARALVEAEFSIASSARQMAELFQNTYRDWLNLNSAAMAKPLTGHKVNLVK